MPLTTTRLSSPAAAVLAGGSILIAGFATKPSFRAPGGAGGGGGGPAGNSRRLARRGPCDRDQPVADVAIVLICPPAGGSGVSREDPGPRFRQGLPIRGVFLARGEAPIDLLASEAQQRSLSPACAYC